MITPSNMIPKPSSAMSFILRLIILPNIVNNEEILPVFEQGHSIERLTELLNDYDITFLSEDFLKKVDSLGWDDESIIEFMKEMSYFSSKERQEIINEILQRS